MRAGCILLLLPVLASCGGEAEESVETVPPPPPRDPLTIPPEIPPGAERMEVHGALTLPWLKKTPGDHVLREAEALAEFLKANGASGASVGTVGFPGRMAIVVARVHETGGHFLEIEAVWKTPDEILVVVRAERPAKGAFVPPLPSFPNASAIIDQASLPVRVARYFRE